MRLGLCYCPQFCTGVSIHAPWEGCDTLIFKDLQNEYTFQFTHPGKGATCCYRSPRGVLLVSIHAPWEGCDQPCTLITCLSVVSIHAPWEGCDKSICLAWRKLFCFNSRTLGRVRHAEDVIDGDIESVSIHAPWEGCDRRGANPDTE